MNNRAFIKNILKYSGPTFVSAIIGVLILPIISRVYPEAEYGYISNFNSIGNLLMGAVFLGLDSAYIRFFHEKLEGSSRNGLFMFALRTGIGVTVVLFFLILMIAPQKCSLFLFNETSIRGVALLGIYVLELTFFRVLNINFRFFDNAKGYNLQQVGFILGNKLLFIVAAIFSTDYFYSVIIMTATTMVVVMISIVFQRNCFCDARISSSARKEMICFALPVMPASIVILLNNSAAKLILGGFGLRDEVGIFAIAISAANIFSMIPTAFSIYWSPFMYKNYVTEAERIRHVHDAVMLFSAVVIIGIFVLQDIVYLILGDNYRNSQSYFMLIMITPLTLLLMETTSYGIAISKKTQYTLYTSLIGCAVNIITCYKLIPYIGSYGAALGVAFSATIIFIMRTIIAQRYYRSIINGVRTAITCCMLWGVCIGNIWMHKHGVIRIFIGAFICCIVIVLYKPLVLKVAYIFKNIIVDRIAKS